MFEPVYGTVTQRKLEMLGRGQLRTTARMELKVACKKVLSKSAKCFLGGVERGDGGEVRVNGKVVSRIIYIDEFDAFNSEERTDTFTERVVLKNASATSLHAAAIVMETSVSGDLGQSMEIDSTIDLVIVGQVPQDIRFVTGIQGLAEARFDRARIATFERAVEERFSADDVFELDKNCAGVLGVDCNACVRDIYVDDGRVTVKGTVSANIVTVKSGETTTITNATHEFDFSKVVHMTGLNAEDNVFGTVAVAGVTLRAENKVKPELVIEVDLAFNGHVVASKEVEFVADAFSFDNALTFATTLAEHTNALPQTNAVADVEGNVMMPANAPFIARILTASGSHLGGVNIGCVDGKVTVEGTIATTVVYECEEKQIHSHIAEVPFNTTIRVEGIGSAFNIQATAGVITCYVKARRGKELMVDAKLGVSISASETFAVDLTSEITVGEAKTRDDSAIMIVMPETGETLWDIAKRIGMSTTEIIRQNPSCEKGITVGEKIFIYRQQVINF
jgi:LysM repeat protein